jgi:hypothetical protein
MTIRSDGFSTELWRTKATKNLPERITLTVSGDGSEIVLGLVGEPASDKTEITILDPFGKPLLSRDFDRRLARPALALPKGINTPFEPGSSYPLPLRNELHPRSDFSPGLCGAKYLRPRIDRSAKGPLFQAACGDEQEPDED